MDIVEDLFEMQKIYHRCIFDGFNEILSDLLFQTKLYGLEAEDIVVFRQPQLLTVDLERLLVRGKSILIDKAMILCGIIKDKEDSLMNESFQNFDGETIEMIREERKTRLVFQDFREDKDNFMTHYDNFFKNMSLLSLSLIIEDELFGDLSQFLLSYK